MAFEFFGDNKTSSDPLGPEFYSTFPSLGKNLAFQWDELRRDLKTLGPIVRATVLEQDTTKNLQDSAVTASEWGEANFHNKYRVHWDKTLAELSVEKNTGAENAPTWDKHLTFTTHNDGRLILSNAKGVVSRVSTTGLGQSRDNDFYYSDEIRFNSENGFYLTKDSDGNPVVNLSQLFGKAKRFNFATKNVEWQINHNFGTVDTQISVYDDNQKLLQTSSQLARSRHLHPQPTAAAEWTVTHNFNTKDVEVEAFDDSGKLLQGDDVRRIDINDKNLTSFYFVRAFAGNAVVTDIDPRHENTRHGIDSADFSDPNTTYFYFSQARSGHAIVSTGGSGAIDLLQVVTFKDGRSSITSTELNFDGNNFYLSKTLAGNPVVNLSFDYVKKTGDTMSGALTIDNTLTVNDDATVAGSFAIAEGLTVGGIIHAEGLYISTAEIFTDSGDNLILDPNGQYTQAKENFIAGDPGNEGDGLNVGGVSVTSVHKTSDIGGANVISHHIHRHSTTFPPILVASTNNTDDNTHAAVIDGQTLFSIWATGRGDSTYEMGGRIDFVVDAIDGSTPGDDNMPTRIDFRTQPPGTGNLIAPIAMSIHPDQHVSMNSSLNVANAVTAEAFYTHDGSEIGATGDFIQRDGSVDFTENQSMGSNKLTGLAAATVAGDAIRFEQMKITVEESDNSNSDEVDTTNTLQFNVADFDIDNTGASPVVSVSAAAGTSINIGETGNVLHTSNIFRVDKTFFYMQGGGTNPIISFKDGSVGSGTGDVVGPDSVNDNRVVRFDGPTGKLIQEATNVTIDDADNLIAQGTVEGLTLRSTGNGTAAAPGYNFALDTGSGMFRVPANGLGLSADGTELVRLTNDTPFDFINLEDRVGINLGVGTVPASTLHVQGDGFFENGKVVAAGFYTSDGAEIGGGGVSDHGELTGLGDDDHTQYSFADGTRAFTGKVTVDAGGIDVQGDVHVINSKVEAAGFYVTGKGDLLPLIAGTNITLTEGATGLTVAATSGGGVSKASETFGSATEWQMTHGLSVTPPQLVWATYDDGMEAIIPQKVDMSDGTIAYFYYATPVAGTAVVIG